MALELRQLSLPIPFRREFSHSSATRRQAENVIVLAEDKSGHVGMGEGCPRAYVTGETLQAAQSFLATHLPALAELRDLVDLQAWMEHHKAAIDLAPSAYCAAELALLDVFARQADLSVEGFLGLPAIRDQTVSAVYSASGALAFAAQALLFRVHGVRDAKLKITGNPSRDLARARWLARFGPVRVDANNLWADARQAIRALAPLRPFIWAVEEPCRPADWAAMAAVQEATQLTLIADESICTIEDLDAVPVNLSLAVNVRVSKHGGLLRTLALLKAVRARGWDTLVGAQVGETSMLARAALSVAASMPQLRGFEAGYGTWLLQYDLTAPTIKVWRGVVRTEQLRSGRGFGLAPSAYLKGVGRLGGQPSAIDS